MDAFYCLEEGSHCVLIWLYEYTVISGGAGGGSGGSSSSSSNRNSSSNNSAIPTQFPSIIPFLNTVPSLTMYFPQSAFIRYHIAYIAVTIFAMFDVIAVIVVDVVLIEDNIVPSFHANVENQIKHYIQFIPVSNNIVKKTIITNTFTFLTPQS
jgi:hypothetical protein